MILYSQKNVYEATKDRLRKIFSYGRRVAVSFSGGKDSTALLGVTLEVAKELGIEKVPVFFIDQECEYTEAVSYMRRVMSMPEVEPYWIQVPFRLWNANNGSWFVPWEPGKEWMREQEPNSYKENIYGVDRFKDLFPRIAVEHFGEDCIYLGGVRVEESLTRRRGLSSGEVLPGITWGKKGEYKNAICLYPLFDWSYKDIWYYIFENRLDYCKIYNYLFSKVPLSKARVSSLIHENSNESIPMLQEIDPIAYNAMYKRIPAIGTVNHILIDVFETLSDHPSCFRDWPDYLYYLIDNIVVETNRGTFRRNLDKTLQAIEKWSDSEKQDAYRTFARGIICEDFVMSKLTNAMLRHNSKHKYKEYDEKMRNTFASKESKEVIL